MKKRRLIIFVLIVAFLLSIGIAGGVMLWNNEKDASSTVIESSSGTEHEFNTVPPIEGNTEIVEERKVLLDKNIFAFIEHSEAKLPVVSGDGNYATDEYGNLIYEDAYTADCTNVKQNLIVIVNKFADAGYPDDAIKYVQRFYFEYRDQLARYESEDLLSKLMSCFTASENTSERISKVVFETFGFEREDNFAFLFEEMLPPSKTVVLFFDVKPSVKIHWDDAFEAHCIYNIWHTEDSDDHYERNMESYLHTIIYKMLEAGASEFDIRLAQLLYCGFIADVEYSANWLHTLLDNFSEGTPDYDILRNKMLDDFGFDIYSNQIISFYYEGITEYNTEVK